MLFSSLTTIASFGSLAISVVVPDASLELTSGASQAFAVYADAVFDMLTGRSRSRSISSATKARRAAQRKVDAATDRVEAKIAEYEVLQEEFQDEVADLVAAWDEKATDIEEITIGLEKNDITVADTVLVWVPRA